LRRIVHLSDIHFGRVDYDVVAKALEKISELQPDLVVVSGDLTQRARTAEYAAAKEFLAGYWIVEVETPERAYAIASEASAAPGPGGKPLNMTIEVRQVMSGPPPTE